MHVVYGSSSTRQAGPAESLGAWSQPVKSYQKQPVQGLGLSEVCVCAVLSVLWLQD